MMFSRSSVTTKVDEMDRPEKLRRVVHEMTPVTPSKEMGRWEDGWKIEYYMNCMELVGISWNCSSICGLQESECFTDHGIFSMFICGVFLGSDICHHHREVSWSNLEVLGQRCDKKRSTSQSQFDGGDLVQA